MENNGNTFDEDIDVKLYIRKGKILKKDKLTIPGINIIDTILDMHFIESAYKIKEIDTVDAYTGYPVQSVSFDYRLNTLFNMISIQEEYEESKEKYNDEIEGIFCYELYEKKD